MNCIAMYSSLFILLLLTAVSGKVNVLFTETTPGTYFKNAENSHGTLDESDLTAIATSLLSINAIRHVGTESSVKVANLINASPFDKPQALATFILAGLPEGSMSGADGLVQLHEADKKESIFRGLTAISQVPSVEHTSLDLSSLTGCGDACLETLLQEAIAGLGLDANYTAAGPSMRGKLLIRMEGQEIGAEFDLQKAADRLMAIELASTWRAVNDAASEKTRRVVQDPESYRLAQSVERVLVSAQALKEVYGADSRQYKAACCLLDQLLSTSVKILRAAYNDRLATVIVTLDSSELENGASDLVSLLEWSSRSQRPARSLLAASNASPTEENYIQGFIAWIAMWGTFFLLLFFAISGCHCLKGMRFKQDSLLYGKNKTD